MGGNWRQQLLRVLGRVVELQITDKGTFKPGLWVRIKNWWLIKWLPNYPDYLHWQKIDYLVSRYGLSGNWHIDDYDKLKS